MVFKKIYKRFQSTGKGFKSTLSFIFASLLTYGLNIITMPIFTRLLSPEEMGVVTTYTAWFNLVYTISSLGVVSGSFNIAMMEYSKERYKYMSSSLSLTTLASAIILSIFIAFQTLIEVSFDLPTILCQMMIIGIFVMPAYNMYLAKQRYEYNYKNIFWVSSVTASLSSLSSLFFVIILKNQQFNLGTIRLIGSNFVTYSIALIFYVYVFKKGKTLIKYKYIKFSVKNNLPLIIHGLSKQILDVSDRIMISILIGKGAVGIFGVLSSISSIATIVWTAINSSLIPFIFKRIDTDKEFEIVKITESLLIIYGIACFFVALIAPEIINILATDEYLQAVYLVPPLATSVFYISLYNTFSNILLFYKKTHLIMLTSIVAALINFILNIIFISKFGTIAAPYTTLFSYGLISVLSYIFMEKVRDTEKQLFDVKNILVITIILTFAILFVNFVYIFPFLRYFIILSFFIILILKRKNLLRMMKFIVKID